MSGFRCWALLLLAVVSLLLPSCIDGNEEVWIHPDGSGRAEITYQIPARATLLKGGDAAVAGMIREFLAGTPEISRSTLDVRTEREITRIQIGVAFDSALSLRNAAQGMDTAHLPDAVRHLAGVVAFSLSGHTLDFSRTMQPGKAVPGMSLIPSQNLQNHHLSYIIHLPGVATTHNATRTENDGRTLIWEVPLQVAVRSPVVTRFQLKIPIPH